MTFLPGGHRARLGEAVAASTRWRLFRSGWLEVVCKRCETRASLPLEHVRRPRDTPIWKLEASLKCRSCKKGRYAPPVHMIRLTKMREIAPYAWIHPDDDRG